ncbi:unnamed protein product [Ranitomeya imitator]|uniref:Superoxide dismutase n=1 Tax=Ranitomeya imitator TaxID=111125 RepID=A0ABN9KYB3_9NEOB|nr:unnamed protein product [Ranitomeya imitator]
MGVAVRIQCLLSSYDVVLFLASVAAPAQKGENKYIFILFRTSLRLAPSLASRQKHTLPDLPYDYGALQPHISAEIMQLHYTKHHATYVNNLNIAEDQYAEALAKGDVTAQVALQPALKFNGGGHINHTIFWTNLSPSGGGEPHGDLLEAIKRDFGSFEKFKEKLSTASVAVQGSGWGWLGYNKESRRLQVATCANQDPLQGTTGETLPSFLLFRLGYTASLAFVA